MRIFITGASGYIGNAVATAFRNAGHSVSGLVRSKEQAKRLRSQEILPIIGDLTQPKNYLTAMNDAEVIVHCALDKEGKSATESLFFETLFDQIKKSGSPSKAFIYTSGIWAVGNTDHQVVDESCICKPINRVKWRLEHEEKLLKMASPSFRIAVLRPGCVFGGSGGLTALWFNSAKTGNIEFIGEGNNHWAMVHIQDLAKAYVLTAEKELNGITLNIVDDTRRTVKEMAQACAQAAGIPGQILSLSEQEGQKRLGSLTEGLLLDQHVSNDRARRLLGWHPSHPGFIRDIDVYYQAWKASAPSTEQTS